MAQNGKQKKPVLVEVEAILAVGEYPEDHPHAGKFAIQVMIKPSIPGSWPTPLLTATSCPSWRPSWARKRC